MGVGDSNGEGVEGKHLKTMKEGELGKHFENKEGTRTAEKNPFDDCGLRRKDDCGLKKLVLRHHLFSPSLLSARHHASPSLQHLAVT